MNKTMIEQNKNITFPSVMIVDDEECIRETLYELLSSEGITALTASGCEECLQHLQQGFHGLILMDVMMPGKNGWQTLKQLDKSGLLRGNIVVMLTALDSPDIQMDGLQEIVIDYITKPFVPSLLVATVRNYLSCLQQIPIED